MDRILKSYMDAFLVSQEIEEAAEDKKFEMFSNYCVVAQHYTEEFSVMDVVVGGSDDCGIDGIAIMINGQLISSKEEFDDILELSKKVYDSKFIFIQAKTSSTFNAGEFGTFGCGVNDFFLEDPKMRRNKEIEEKCSLVSYIIDKASYMEEKPVCYLYYITTGTWNENQNFSARMEHVKKDLDEQNLFKEINILPIDANLLQKYYRNTIDVTEAEINFDDKILLPDIPEVNQAYLGCIRYKEYLKLITNESGELNRCVFYDNVRDYQGDNSINKDIAETIENKADKFVLFNNGVTIICKKLRSTRNIFTLSDFQIVNGCQTSHLIFKNKPQNEDTMYIPIKLIETEDEEIINGIIKSTNRQTQVTRDQLLAVNEFHRKLEAYYATFSGTDRLYYERRSKQYKSDQSVEKARIVSIRIQMKAVAAMFFDKPHLATRFYSKLFDYEEEIFKEDHSCMPYYTSAFVLYRLESLLKNKRIAAEYKKFKYFILMLLKLEVAENNNVPYLNSKKIDQFCNKILAVARDDEKFLSMVNKVIKLLDKNVEDIDDIESTKSATLVSNLKKEYTVNKGKNNNKKKK